MNLELLAILQRNADRIEMAPYKGDVEQVCRHVREEMNRLPEYLKWAIDLHAFEWIRRVTGIHRQIHFATSNDVLRAGTSANKRFSEMFKILA